MEDWKRRLVEEYNQLKERYEKLRAFRNKREVEHVLSVESDFPSQEDRIARKRSVTEPICLNGSSTQWASISTCSKFVPSLKALTL
ncbi:MAG: hypothetical protein K6B74_04750 [Ruminococcus sp.]|nr:hypothetical protein [Ruminococcus sp.]